MTYKSVQKRNSGWLHLCRPAFAMVLCLSLTAISVVPDGPGFAQTQSNGEERKFTPSEWVVMFQDGVDAYRLGQYRKSYNSWLPLARAGDHAAQRNIAHLWLHGLGVQKSLSEAIPWLRMSAEGGIVESYTQLGLLYARHPDLDRDYRKAAEYFYFAARNNDASAQYNLGLMYENGLGVPANRNTAGAWYGFAARSGHFQAAQRITVLRIAPNLAGGYPPAPDFTVQKAAELSQPRVVEQAADNERDSLDNLINAINRSATSTDEPEDQAEKKPSDDLLSALASNISRQDNAGRGSLPASAYIDNTIEAEVVDPSGQTDTPALQPETAGPGQDAAPAPRILEPDETDEPDLAAASGDSRTQDPGTSPVTMETPAPASPVPESDIVPQDVEIARIPQAKPALPEPPNAPAQPVLPAPEEVSLDAQEVVSAVASMPAGSGRIPSAESLEIGPVSTEPTLPSRAPVPEIAAEETRLAWIPRPKPALPAPPNRLKATAIPVSEELGLSQQDAVPANIPASARRADLSGLETIIAGQDEPPGPLLQTTTGPQAPQIETALVDILGATGSGDAIGAEDTASRALPQEQSSVSMALGADHSEAFVAIDALPDVPPPTVPKVKPATMADGETVGQLTALPQSKPEAVEKAASETPAGPAIVDKPVPDPVQVASVVKKQRPARKNRRAAALSAYKRGELSQAVQIWSSLASRGDVVSRFWLGRLYNRGEGVSRDPARAYELIKSAARSGYSPAVTALANLQARMSDQELRSLESALSNN